jgi:pimeloyl-ACP methyl ester carboxylesterase
MTGALFARADREAAEPERIEIPGRHVRLVADRWEAVGPARGTLVLSPGGGQTRHSWDEAARRLRLAGWTAYTLDPRGHGESEWAPRPDAAYGTDVQSEDLIDVLHSILERDGGPVVLIGASMGGMTSLVSASQHPELVSGLVLVDIVPRTAPEGVIRIKEFMSRGLQGFDDFDEVIAAVAAYRPGQPRSTDPSRLRRNVRHGEDGRLYWHWDPEFHRPGNGLSDREANRRVLLDAAQRVVAATLIVHGAESDVVGADGIEELLSVIPHAEVAAIAEAGHMVVGDDNDAFIDAVLDFLDRQQARDVHEAGDDR